MNEGILYSSWLHLIPLLPTSTFHNFKNIYAYEPSLLTLNISCKLSYKCLSTLPEEHEVTNLHVISIQSFKKDVDASMYEYVCV